MSRGIGRPSAVLGTSEVEDVSKWKEGGNTKGRESRRTCPEAPRKWDGVEVAAATEVVVEAGVGTADVVVAARVRSVGGVAWLASSESGTGADGVNADMMLNDIENVWRW